MNATTRAVSSYRAVELSDSVEGVITGYVFIWGSPQRKDAYDTYFDRSRPPQYSYSGDLAGYPIAWEHGLDPQVGKTPVGVITRTWFDDVGLAFEGKLDKGSPMFERALADISAGKKKTSSSSANHMAEWYDDGAFRNWMMTELSLVDDPAEYLMPSVSLIRSAGDDRDDHSDEHSADTTLTEDQANGDIRSMDMPQEGQKTVEDALKELVAAYGLEAVQAAVAQVTAPSVAMSDPAAAPRSANALTELKGILEAMKAEQEQSALRADVKSLRDELAAMRNAPPKDEPQIVRGKGQDISVSEDLRYAHLTAEQMALGVKLVLAGVPETFRSRYKLRDMVDSGILSEDYMRSMAFKANSVIRNMKPRADAISQVDNAALRAAVPFRADELHATDIVAHGAEWVETFYDTTLWERARDRTELFNLLVSRGMETVTIPRGANTMNVKTNTASGTVYTLGQGGSVDASGRPEVVAKLSQITTGEVEEPVSAHVLAHGVTMFMEEDSIINIMSWLPGEMEQTLAESLESTIINGDKTATASANINLIDSTPSGGLETPAYIAWDGLRHNFNVDNTAYQRSAGAALQLTDFENTLALFPSAIINRRNQMLFIVDKKTETATRKLPELLTVGVAGQQATIYSGSLPPLFGVDLYMSGFLALANTSGRISATPGNNTTGTIVAVYAPYWKYGRKRSIIIEQDRSALQQATVFVATVRHTLKARGAAAAAGTINLTV